ncbi:MAG: hypothetical protein HYU68_02425 [Bacteroidetes bacterium]|nr:hypothetical protein [Bacteroidota bacterium]
MDLTSSTLWSIITSLVASVIFYFLLPLIKKLSNYFVVFMSTISKKYSNSLYKSLALGKSFEPLMLILLITPITILTNLLLIQIVKNIDSNVTRIEIESKIDYYNNENQTINDRLNLLDSSYVKGVDSVIALEPSAFFKRQEENLEKRKGINESIIEIYKKMLENDVPPSLYLGLFLTLIFITILIFYYYSKYQFIFSQTNKFEHKLTLIRPHLDNKEYLELRKTWALIKNVEDFKNIENTIEEYFYKFESNNKQ